jgi:hypothetical protein
VSGMIDGGRCRCTQCGENVLEPIVLAASLLTNIHDRDPATYEMNPGADKYPRARWELEWSQRNRWSKTWGRIMRAYYPYCRFCLPGRPGPDADKNLRRINPIKKELRV